jgi:putative ABC transport system permease protein
MTLLTILCKSLWNRRLTTVLTIFSIALSVLLLLGIERVRLGARDSFSNTISQTDLIVGAKGGTLQLLLYSVFRLGSATANISYESFEKLRNHPAVKWVIPYSLGDSHRGFRVVGTNEDFYVNYRYRQDRTVTFAEGQAPMQVFDVALGSEVAEALKYKMGDSVAVAHGISDGPAIISHDDKPFKVVGILNKTGTPIDRSLYITLEGLEAIHMDWTDGAPPRRGEETPAHSIRKEDIKIAQITAALVRTKNRFETLMLQREINTYTEEPLMAIIPGVALGELWSVVSYAEDGLRIVSWAVLVVGLLAMLISIYTSLQERRREMAILRSVGAGLKTIAALLIIEATLLTFVGIALGVLLTYVVLLLSRPLIESSFGMLIPIQPLSIMEWIFLGVILVAGFLLGLAPAIKAYRNSLADGLAIRFLIPFVAFFIPQVSEAKTLQVASSVSWLRELAYEITCGGKGVELLPAIVPPGTDPHSYKLTPRSRMIWSKADVRLIIGEGFESWPEKNAGSASKLFTATKNMNLRVLDSHAEGETAETEGHAHSHSKIGNSFDPHIWHSPRLTREAALNLYNFLAPRAPAMRNEWDTCLRTFVQRTKAVESAVHAKIATIPSTRRVLATNHDSMGYFASTFGLKIVAISGVSTEAQVTPGQLKRAIDAIKKTGAKAVFVESSASPETVQKVAAEAGVKVGGELFTDGLSAPGTPAGNITGLWETNAETLATSLRP